MLTTLKTNGALLKLMQFKIKAESSHSGAFYITFDLHLDTKLLSIDYRTKNIPYMMIQSSTTVTLSRTTVTLSHWQPRELPKLTSTFCMLTADLSDQG